MIHGRRLSTIWTVLLLAAAGQAIIAGGAARLLAFVTLPIALVVLFFLLGPASRDEPD